MDTSYVSSVRLTSFKSFTDQELPLDELTLLVGRNGSGKSNALSSTWLATAFSGAATRPSWLSGTCSVAVPR